MVAAPEPFAFQRVRLGRLQFWRVAKPNHLWDVSRGAARWSRDGDPIIYASCSAGLAVLEALAHLKRADAQRAHRLATIGTSLRSDDVLMLAPQSLPRGWKQQKPLTRRIARQWLDAHSSAALLVPSSLVGGEMNLLIDARSLRWRQWSQLSEDYPFRFDRRIR